jgi:hypothetical protein
MLTFNNYPIKISLTEQIPAGSLRESKMFRALKNLRIKSEDKTHEKNQT